MPTAESNLIRTLLEEPKPLSLEQREAVLANDRFLRIVAHAGAGKTETLTCRIVRFLIEGVPPEAIVAFTFTERAAQSLKERVSRRVRQLRLTDAHQRLGDLFVGTIHSYCVRLLQQYGGLGNFDPLTDHQEVAFVARYGWPQHLNLQQIPQAARVSFPDAVELFLKSVSVVHDELLSLERLKKKVPEFAEAFQKYTALLEDHRLLTFGQMITRVVDQLGQATPLRKAVHESLKHLFVDEYQDVSPAQARLVNFMSSGGASVTVVGDPRQCIYQWRGSDVACFEEFLNEFRGCRTVSITENRRSVPAVIEAANAFARSFSKERPMVAVRKSNGPAAWEAIRGDKEDEAAWVAEQTQQLLKAGREGQQFAPSEITILVRSVHTSAPSIIAEFEARGIPFLVGGRTGLFRRREAQVLGAIFAWFGDGIWPVDPASPYKRETMDEDLLSEGLRDKWRPRLTDLDKTMRAIRSLKAEAHEGKYSNLAALYQDLLVQLGILDLRPEREDDTVRLAVLGRFNELLADYESMNRRGEPGHGRRIDWPSFFKGLMWYLNTYAVSAYEEQRPDTWATGADAVQIMTIHQAKGLEWPVVFMPALTSRRMPSSHTGKAQDWFLSRDLFPVDRYEGSDVDERRLFYVGMTRARDGLYFSWFKRYDRSAASPSPYLAPLKGLLMHPAGTPVRQDRPPDSDDLLTFAPHDVILYRRCPYRFRLGRLWGFQPGIDQAIGYGKALHHVLRVTADRAKNGEKVTVGMLLDLLNREFFLPFAGKHVAEQLRAAAEKALTRYLHTEGKSFEYVEQAEARLEFPLQNCMTGENCTIGGVVDVLLRPGSDGLEVRDYKTAQDKVVEEEAVLQVQLYAAGLVRVGKTVQKGSVANLSDGTVRNIDVSPSSLDQAVKEAQTATDGIRASKYPGKVGAHCRSCDFNGICRHYANSRDQ